MVMELQKWLCRLAFNLQVRVKRYGNRTLVEGQGDLVPGKKWLKAEEKHVKTR
jgi:hypothetical protein